MAWIDVQMAGPKEVGLCTRVDCVNRISKGELVSYESHGVVCNSCTRERLEEEAGRSAATQREPYDDDEELLAALKLPRGKTVADTCPRCFQIPATSGVCGC